MPAVFSIKARDDFKDILTFIARDNPERAFTYVHELESHCHNLSRTPSLGRERGDISPGLRILPHGTYLIFYRILETNIRIERILHSARDYGELFDS